MALGDEDGAKRFTMICVRCGRPLRARRAWVGRDVQCPHCASVLRVPSPPEEDRPVRARRPTLAPRLQFNFGCPRCDTLLEAHTGLCGQAGRCPTCGARLVVPDVDLGSGRPREPALLDAGDGQRPPVHAYAASGRQAPQIRRRADGSYTIECPRCSAHCAVDADSCPSCGAPFTIEAAPTVRTARRNARARTAVVLGLLSLPLCIMVVPAVAAVVSGFLSLGGGMGERPWGLALVGIALGLLSLVLGAGVVLWFI